MVTVLRPAEEFAEQVADVLDTERRRLAALGVPGDLQLVGGCSVPGAVTRGDVDLHLRVPAAGFADVVAALRSTHPVVHPEIWGPTLATFDVPAPVPAGLAVTPAGSEHDLRFTRTWQLLAADPDLVAEYNAVKRAGNGLLDEAAYEQRKSAFFDRLVARWPSHPAGGGDPTCPDHRSRPDVSAGHPRV